MRGHIQQRGEDRWRIKAYVGRDATGTKRYAQRTVAGSHRDAERELSRLLVEVDEGRFVASAAMTLHDLLDAAYDDDPAFGMYLWVSSATGCRRGEVCALRWTDVDLDGRQLSVRRAIVQVDGALREKDTKTHQSRRMALDEPTVVLLRQHHLRQREQALALGVGLADDALLFANAEGRPWRPDVCTNRFSRLRKKLGLDHVRLHDLRHFVASVLIDGGIPISTVSARLGHSQISTTLNLYTHAIPATDQKAADYLGDLLSQHRPPRAKGA